MLASAVGFLAVLAVAHAAPRQSAPTVAVRNGTYTGVHSTTYDQDFFLGMPYAQQPLGNLRFTVPQPLNESWNGARDAKEYSDICVGYGVSFNFVHMCIKDHVDRCRRILSGTPDPKLV
jgi:triacylglycerol lipase